eukprot:gene4714-4895_t
MGNGGSKADCQPSTAAAPSRPSEMGARALGVSVIEAFRPYNAFFVVPNEVAVWTSFFLCDADLASLFSVSSHLRASAGPLITYHRRVAGFVLYCKLSFGRVPRALDGFIGWEGALAACDTFQAHAQAPLASSCPCLLPEPPPPSARYLDLLLTATLADGAPTAKQPQGGPFFEAPVQPLSLGQGFMPPLAVDAIFSAALPLPGPPPVCLAPLRAPSSSLSPLLLP